jgi:seryl-tRNA synthetase
MLSIKFMRENKDRVIKSVKNKNVELDIEHLLHLDEERRKIIGTAEKMKAKRNHVSLDIANKKKQGGNVDEEIKMMQTVSREIKEMDTDLKAIETELNNLLLYVPNIIHPSVPIGKDESSNELVREWGTKIIHGFEAKDHLELGETLNLFDFKRSAKMSGSGFPLYTGKGAKLERSLINFMLDTHVEKHGYTELFPPFMTNRVATTTTGQLPKFEEDMYHIGGDDMFMISTAEVPVTNIHKDEILKENDLPMKYSAYSACFRREAGSYGKDTRGLMRLHQFNKVEMVKFTHPDSSYNELELLLADAEDILQALNLHYRIVVLASGDLSFSAAKCYDIEVWSPVLGKYLEVSSCSNFEAFQARRGNIRFRSDADRKVDFVHTLNGSGLATPRLMIALLETYQQVDGSVRIPEALHPYMADLYLRA